MDYTLTLAIAYTLNGVGIYCITRQLSGDDPLYRGIGSALGLTILWPLFMLISMVEAIVDAW